MNFQIALLLCILAIALTLFSWERFSADEVVRRKPTLVFRTVAKGQGVRWFWQRRGYHDPGLLILTAALSARGGRTDRRAVLSHTGKDLTVCIDCDRRLRRT
jgi:hypothetical protein